MKTVIDSFYGTLIMAGFILLMCCDTENPGQLLVVCLAGFGLVCFGGRALIKRCM